MTSEKKWTPGPMRVNRYDAYGVEVLSEGPKKFQLADVYGEDLEQRLANAHLFAAADAMYDALENLVNDVRNPGDHTTAILHAKKALAEARGESHD